MSNLLSSLRSAADTLDVLQQSVATTQNNIQNASTPGYVRQTLALESLAFDPKSGLMGGVSAGQLQSSRDTYAEGNVRNQAVASGKATQDSKSLTALETAFPVNDSGGISATLNKLLQSFSAWSVSPNSSAAQQNVVAAADTLASSFHQTANQLSQMTLNTNQDLQTTATQINTLVGNIRDYNEKRQSSGMSSEGAETQVYNTLEQLSDLADVSVLKQNDGTFTLLLDGQSNLLVGTKQTTLKVAYSTPTTPIPTYPGAVPVASIVDSDGKDVSSHVSTGKLGSLLEFRNKTLPQYQGDSQQPGVLNQIAKGLADRVNQILSPGHELFSYSSTSDGMAAQTLTVNKSLNFNAIPASTDGAANGRALQLAGLATSTNPSDGISGMSFSAYLGQVTASVGQKVSNAAATQSSQAQITAQARNLRSQLSGVSLDQEAVRIVEFQRAYQATSQMVSVINSMSDAVMQILR